MFDFIDCLEAETVPGYEPKRPLRFGGSRAGAAIAGRARPCDGGAPPPGRGQRRERLPHAGGCGWDPLPGPALPCICDVPERNERGSSPVLTSTFALPEAIWIPQTGRNDTKHFGDIRCVVVDS